VLVTLDFETYHDKDYTLKKLSTSEYVRDRRFEALSCAIKIDDGPTTTYFGVRDITRALDSIRWTEATVLAHHAHFDGLILTHHFGRRPKRWACTLSMARGWLPRSEKNGLDAVAQRLGKGHKLEMPDIAGKHLVDLTEEEKEDLRVYNDADVDLCYGIFRDLVDQGFPERELDLIDVTVRMFAEPKLRLDRKRAKAELQREIEHRKTVIETCGAAEEELMSSAKFAAKLQELGAPVPTKISPRTGKSTYAFAKTDEEFTAMKRYPDERVARLVEARLIVKSTINESRATRLIAAGRSSMSIPVYLNYCGAHTTRWSGGDKMNFQNLPRGGELRKSLIAPRGYVIVVADSSQIEARTLAWLAHEQWLLDAFREGRDVYSEFASVAYGRTIAKADKLERQVGKVCILGLGYSMGAFKLRLFLLNQGVDLPLTVCERLVDVYRRKNRCIVSLWDRLGDVIGDMYLGIFGEHGPLRWGKEHILLPSGLSLHYPDVRCTSAPEVRTPMGTFRSKVYDGSYLTYAGRTKIYGGLVTENVVQALARVVVGEQMLKIAERYPDIVLMSHDEVGFLAPAKDAEAALQYALQVMSTPPAWAPDIPLAAEGGFDKCYSK
jgi:hypothetical protein